MVDGFEIEVPITLKGGREGEKVGKQIGNKIAEQIKKSFRAIGISKPTGAATGGIGDIAGMMGVSKGLKGVATKLGVIGVAIGAAVGILAKSSPYLKGILSIFGRAFMIFFRPFGDFLATLLRPLAILMMKMAVAFIKWTRPITGKVREAVEGVPQFELVDNALANFAIEIANWALKLGAAIGAVIWEIGKAAFDLGTKIGEWLLYKVIVPAADWLYDKIVGLLAWTINFGTWLWDQLKSVWDYVGNFGTWLWEKITSIWNYLGDFGSWLWDQLKSIWSWDFDLGKWLLGQIKSALTFTLPVLGGFGGGQVGIPNVPREGLYHLHAGEEVVPRTKAGQNRSVIFKPTYQISGEGITKDIDMDAVVRRMGRMTEMDLKQRGII